ncbi:MAG: NADH-quinone oxidoreductase subunit J [Tepidiforma sp.]|jgi:NADH:ubiquinone oxidoreductase subunit 6 (subunit J)|uniref:NADH-quinone oxidoreductase subunit J family protein n=1 Tax=Tepidiforma sp. TaxID=2682230 RepID=UPI0021DCC08E|nr:NADH-quinone oxidoreductase subunit J [Tepidiforma sp.]MCX7617463.1 NADH-quinone oxidoreductase subunit J [Tepidiforma sp.]GIW17519.1 MAG: NADH dehydrogenase [Tepidiforma sp.]
MEGFGPSLAFWVLAALTLVAAGGVMVSRNLLHAVLFLILTFIGVAGFFVLLSADFIAMAQVIIYVGAIAVLVLFAVLLTPRSGRDNGETRWALPGILLAVCLAAIFLFVVHDTAWNTVDEAPAGLDARSLGTALLTTWVVPFEIASVLLTAALVGAIMLTRSPEEEAEDALV